MSQLSLPDWCTCVLRNLRLCAACDLERINKWSFSLKCGIEMNEVFVNFIINQSSVIWVDPWAEVHPLNKWANEIVQVSILCIKTISEDLIHSRVQSRNFSLSSMWSRGLRGEGQIVGTGDTGIGL